MKTFLLVLFVLLFISPIDFAQVREFEPSRNSPPKIITHEKTALWPAQSFYQRKSEWQWIVDSTWGPIMSHLAWTLKDGHSASWNVNISHMPLNPGTPLFLIPSYVIWDVSHFGASITADSAGEIFVFKKYEKEIVVLEKKNMELRNKLTNYKYEGKDNWEEFKDDFNREVDEVVVGINDIFSKND